MLSDLMLSDLIQMRLDLDSALNVLDHRTAERDAALVREASANAEIARLREEARFIPCSERLPDVGDDVLVHNRNGDIDKAYLDRARRYFWADNSERAIPVAHVTHWRALPEGPTE